MVNSATQLTLGEAMAPFWIHRLPEQLRIILKSNRVSSILFGLLVGLFINLITDSSVKTAEDFGSILRSGRLSSHLFLSCLVALLLLFPARHTLDWYRRRRGDDALLAKMLAGRVDASIAPFAGGYIAVGSALTLQLASDLTEGLGLQDVQVCYSGDFFSLSSDLRGPYESFYRENYHCMHFRDDNTKYCIREDPAAYIDAPTLILELQRTKYSEVQFYKDSVMRSNSFRRKLIQELRETTKIRFAHSLCMHAVVITSDGKVLLTQRSSKVSYYPRAWSVSVEEQLSELDDPASAEGGVVLRWAKRALREELSVLEEHYDVRNLRALAVFLEGEILNCSLATLLPLGISSHELDVILRSRPREDHEFESWQFLTFQELAKEFLHPMRTLHPTSGYRMLLSLYHHFGAPKLAQVLFHQDRAT